MRCDGAIYSLRYTLFILVYFMQGICQNLIFAFDGLQEPDGLFDGLERGLDGGFFFLAQQFQNATTEPESNVFQGFNS